MSIKVLFVHGGTLEKAGTEAYMMNVLKYAKENNIQIDFLVFGCTPGFYDEKVLKMNSKIYRIPYRPIDLKYKEDSIKTIKRKIKKENYDIVHSHMNALNHLVFKQMKKLGIKHFVSHSHASKHFVENKAIIHFKEKQKTKIKNDTKVLLACSQEAGEFLYQEQEFTIIKNGIDVQRFALNPTKRDEIRKELQIEDQLVIGHAGRFTFEKNHQFIIKIIKELTKLQSNITLLLLGVGPLQEEIKQEVKKYELEKQVLFLDMVDNIEDYYQAMDVFVLPSLFEGFGYVLIEAQASGLLCFASSQVPKLTRASDKIFYLDLDDSKLWAQEIIKRQYYQRKDNTNELYNLGFDPKSEVIKLFEIYENMLKK